MSENISEKADQTNTLLNKDDGSPKTEVSDKSQENSCISGYIKSKLVRFQGLFTALLGAFFLSLSGILNRKARFVTGSEQSAIRYSMQFFIILFIAYRNKINIFGPKEQRRLLAIRGCCGAFAFISLGFSLKYIDPSDTQALFNTRIIIIALLARIFLKEKLTIIHIVCLVLTICGVIFISQPSFLVDKIEKIKNHTLANSTTHLSNEPTGIYVYIGFTLGLTSAFGASIVAVLIKKLSDLKVHYSINVVYASYIGLPISLTISLIMYLTNVRNVDPSVYDSSEKLAWQIFYSFSSAACSCTHQLLVTVSNRHEDAAKLAIISTTNLFWTFLLQYAFLDIGANLYGVSGAIFIFLAVILSIVFKIIDQKLKSKTSKEDVKQVTEENFLKRIIFFKF